MKIEKVSISLPKQMMLFVEQYRRQHKLRSRSDVFAKAVKVLEERSLEQDYRDSYRDHAEEMKAWDVTVGDGLDDEPW
jgi:metal-responsive CopG/Arc/MetJ family transcriptional regulator